MSTRKVTKVTTLPKKKIQTPDDDVNSTTTANASNPPSHDAIVVRKEVDSTVTKPESVTTEHAKSLQMPPPPVVIEPVKTASIPIDDAKTRKRKLEDVVHSSKLDDTRDMKRVAHGEKKCVDTNASAGVLHHDVKSSTKTPTTLVTDSSSNSIEERKPTHHIFDHCVIVVVNDIENNHIFMVKMKEGSVTSRQMAILRRCTGNTVEGQLIKSQSGVATTASNNNAPNTLWNDTSKNKGVENTMKEEEEEEEVETEFIEFEEDETCGSPLFSTICSLSMAKKLHPTSIGKNWEIINSASKQIVALGEICTDIFYIVIKVKWTSNV